MQNKEKLPAPFSLIGDSPCSEHGACPIHFWSSNDNERLLIDCFADSGPEVLKTTDFYGNSPLHYSVFFSAYSASRFIVTALKSYNFYNCDQITPAHLAAIKGDVKMLQILVKSSVLLQSLTYNGWSPFHFAILHEQLEAAKYILENSNKSIINSIVKGPPMSNQNQNYKFYTPLDIAQTTKNQQIIDFLLSNNAYPSLHASIINKDYRCLSYHLFSKKSSKDLDIRSPNTGCTALHLAAYFGNYQFCNSLLESGASADVEDKYHMTPLDYSIVTNSYNTFTVISQYTCQKYLTKSFFIASDLNRLQFYSPLERLIDDLTYSNDDDEILFVHLIKRNLSQYISPLLTLPCNLEQKDKNGTTFFHYCGLLPNNSTLIEQLEQKKQFDYNCKDRNGLIPYTYAARLNNYSMIKQLKEKSDLNYIDSYGMSPILYTLFDESRTLLTLPTNKFQKFTINVKELVRTLQVKNSKILFYNYNQNEEINYECETITMFSNSYQTALTSSTIDLFLKKTNGILYGGTILHAAILFGVNSGNIAKYYNELINVPNDLGQTPLQFAALIRRADIVAVLINLNANLFLKDNNGNSLFHFVDDPLVFKFVNDITKNVYINDEYINNEGETPIHIACKNNSIDILKCFIKIINDYTVLSLPDKKGLTPLDYAFKTHSNECIDFLHSFGVENLLINAIKNNDIKLVKELVKNNYSINSCDRGLFTPLHISIQQQNLEITKFLLDQNADINAKTTKGFTPLHIAAQQNNYELCYLLLSRNIKLNDFKQDEQPYLLSTDPKIIIFLCHYWKRQFLGNIFLDFITQTQKMIGYIKINTFEIIKLTDKDNKNYNFLHNFEDVIQNIEFITNRIRNYGIRSTHNKYNYIDSIHHLLMILNVIDLQQYINQFEKSIENSINYFVSIEDSTLSILQIIFVFIFPLKFIQLITSFLMILKQFLIPEIDNINLYDSILDKYKEISHKIRSCINLSQQLLMNNLINPLDKEIISKSCIGQLTTFCFGIIRKVNNKPQCVLTPQQYISLKNIFGDEFELPRLIPFTKGEHIRIYIKGLNLLIMSSKDSFIIPLFFVNIINKKVLI